MAIINVTNTWSTPVTLTEKTLVAVNYGYVLLALGSDDPADDQDGTPIRAGFMGVFETGTTIRFRTPNATNGRHQIYYGPVA